MRRLLIGFLTYVLTHVVWTSNLALYVDRKWGFGVSDVGWMLAYVGLVTILFRGVLISRMINKWGERRLQRWGMSAIAIGLLGFLGNGGVLWLGASLTLLSFGSGIIRPLIMGEVSRKATEREQGAVMGVTNALGSVAQVFGPLMGGFMLTYLIPESVIILAFLIMVPSVGLVLFRKDKRD